VIDGGRRPSVEMLRADSILGGMEDDTLAPLADAARVVDVRAGGRLTAQGAPADVVWVVLSGKWRRELAGDHNTRLLLDAGASRLIDGYHAFIGAGSFCTITAVTAVRAVAIPVAAFRNAAEQDSRVAHLVLEHLAAEMRELLGATAALACLTPAVRLARHLVAIVDEDRRIRLLGNQRDLADQLAVSRQTVNYLIGNLVEDGIVVRIPGRNQFLVADPDRLAERAALTPASRTRAGEGLSTSASDAA
jgi:CRP-like cAMP-binding protein